MSDNDSDSSEEINKKQPEGNAGRCVKKSSKRVYNNKRKFGGNQYTKIKKNNGTERRKSVVSDEAKRTSTSGKKVVDVPVSSIPKHNEDIQGYRIIDMFILDAMINKLLCPKCKDFGLNLYEDQPKRRGMASLIFIKCTKCDSYYQENFTSKPVQHVSPTQGRCKYDINVRSVYAMRDI